MKLNDILEEWKKDSKLSYEDLDKDSLHLANLHAKYLEHYSREKLNLSILTEKLYPKLRIEKREFYTMGAHEDTPEDWNLPPSGKVLIKDVNEYLAADNDMIKINLQISQQKLIVDVLREILDDMKDKRWSIKNIIDFRKITGGD